MPKTPCKKLAWVVVALFANIEARADTNDFFAKIKTASTPEAMAVVAQEFMAATIQACNEKKRQTIPGIEILARKVPSILGGSTADLDKLPDQGLEISVLDRQTLLDSSALSTECRENLNVVMHAATPPLVSAMFEVTAYSGQLQFIRATKSAHTYRDLNTLLADGSAKRKQRFLRVVQLANEVSMSSTIEAQEVVREAEQDLLKSLDEYDKEWKMDSPAGNMVCRPVGAFRACLGESKKVGV